MIRGILLVRGPHVDDCPKCFAEYYTGVSFGARPLDKLACPDDAPNSHHCHVMEFPFPTRLEDVQRKAAFVNAALLAPIEDEDYPGQLEAVGLKYVEG